MEQTATQKADDLLAQIGQTAASLETLKMSAQAAIEWVTAQWADKTGEQEKKLKDLEAQLKALLRKHKGELFAQGDRLDLTAGAVLWKIASRVRRARVVLGNLQKLGWYTAIRVVEEVRWNVLEEWPEERWIACGTERVQKEDFEYEIFQVRETARHDQAGSLPGPAGKE